MPDKPKVYFSYAWGDNETPEGRLRSDAANALYQELKAREKRGELQVMIDREQMRYGSSIRAFTQQFGKASIVVMVISEKYLCSRFCMAEVVEVLSNRDYRARIFPVVLPDVKLDDDPQLPKYQKFWEEKKRKLAQGIDEIEDKAAAIPLEERQQDIQGIIDIISHFTTELGDLILARPPDYTPLLKALDARIAELKKVGLSEDVVHLFDKKKPGEYDCISCNRDEHFNEVACLLGERNAVPVLHIFLPSSIEDSAESFVSRIYYDSRLFPENDRYSPAQQRTLAGGGEHREALRLTAKELHASLAIKEIQQSIQSLAGSDYPSHVLLLFVIRLKYWSEGPTGAFFEHILKEEMARACPDKKIRIFYWLDLTGCRKAGFWDKVVGRKSPLEAFLQCCPRHEAVCSLEPLPKVCQDDLKMWFSQFSRQLLHCQQHIEALFQGRSETDMAAVEEYLFRLVTPLHNTYR